MADAENRFSAMRSWEIKIDKEQNLLFLGIIIEVGNLELVKKCQKKIR